MVTRTYTCFGPFLRTAQAYYPVSEGGDKRKKQFNTEEEAEKEKKI